MISRSLIISLILLFIPITSAASDEVNIQISGNLRGRLDGCDCPSGQSGGWARRVKALQDRFGTISVPGFDSGAFLDLDPEGGDIRSRCALRGLADVGIKTAGITTRDMFYGVEFLKSAAQSTGFTLVSANIIDVESREPIFEIWTELTIDHYRFAITSLSRYQPGRGFENSVGWTKVSPDSVIEKVYQMKPGQADFYVLLTDLSEAALREFIPAHPFFNIVSTCSRQFYSSNHFFIGETIVVHTKPDGRALEWITIDPDKKLSFSKVELTPEFEEDTAMKNWIRECFSNEIEK